MANKKEEQNNGVEIPQVERQLPSDGKDKQEIVKREVDPYALMDSLDDTAIIAELEGRVVGTWVYHFPQEGQEVWGLSKVGVDAACREMAKLGEVIREIDIKFEVDPSTDGYFLFTAKAARFAINKDTGTAIELDSAFGTKRQANHHPKGGYNKFWFEQGSIKALRNARQRLISEDVRAKIMALAKEKGKVREVDRPKYNKKTPPPSPAKNGETTDRDREQAIGAILEKLKGIGVDDKHQDRLLCKIAGHLGTEPVPKVIKDIPSEDLPEIQKFLFTMQKQVKLPKQTGDEIELADFSTLLNEVIREIK